MKKLILLILVIAGFSIETYSQSPWWQKSDIQFNYLTEFSVNGNRYGTNIEYNTLLLRSSANTYRLNIGLMNEFFIKDERDIEGITGNTVSNIIGATISNRFLVLKNRQMSVTNTLYLGWGYRRTKANYSNDLYTINRDYESDFHTLAFGAYWKIGYYIRENISLQGIGKTDFSRLIDKYEATIFERPGFMYGIGITYEFE